MNCLKYIFIVGFGALLLFSCSPARNGYRRGGRQIEKQVRKSQVFNRAFTGFTLVDPETGRHVADVNGDHFFTPASTTKILTLYTCLKLLGDSVPALDVWHEKIPGKGISRLHVRGLGDPTFLHPSFQAWQSSFSFLQNQPDSVLLFPDHYRKRFGPGWAWDDYNYAFQPERTMFPMYGGIIRFKKKGDSIDIQPPFFKHNFTQFPYYAGPPERLENKNEWIIPNDLKDTILSLPFRYDPFKLDSMLADTLHKSVRVSEVYEFDYAFDHIEGRRTPWKTLYSTPVDTVLRRMMHQSDNFIAEQMLDVCIYRHFPDRKNVMEWVLDSVLSDLPQRPRWVDGSGLSRYNLISPQDLSTVLLHLWREQPHETLLSYFPKGGKDGTLADWYAGKDGKPYVFAKSGSMSGVTCLSGFVRTNHGKTLIFTFMTNHFVGSSRDWKVEMQQILEIVGAW